MTPVNTFIAMATIPGWGRIRVTVTTTHQLSARERRKRAQQLGAETESWRGRDLGKQGRRLLDRLESIMRHYPDATDATAEILPLEDPAQ